MKTLRFHSLTLSTLVALALLAQPQAIEAESQPVADNPMAEFERLVGGEWQISILRHRFEWGIGNHTVISKSYDAEGNLAAEARWFWHPTERAIKGYSIDASGQAFTEMTTRFEGDTMVNDLEMVNPDGSTASYTGQWVFDGDDRYDWTLFSRGADGGTTQMMQATATRSAADGAGR